MIFFCLLSVLNPLAALYFGGPVAVLTALMVVGWIGIGVFPLFMGVIPAETLGRAQAATAMGLIVAVGELTGGVFGPIVSGWLADDFGLAVPLMIQRGWAVAAGLCAFGLKETNPRFVGDKA